MRKTIFSSWALLLVLSLGAGYASADATVKTPKGKPGASCKTDSDCDQTQQPQSCNSGKCQVFRVPPPT